tara:strand:+ start:121 stop:573 length:453 start_codon:yes stop_codon:yes gene_type:complete
MIDSIGYLLARFILLPGIFIIVGWSIFAQGILLAGRSGVFEFEVLGIFAAFVGIVGIVSAILYAIFLERINKFFTIVSVIEIVMIILMATIPFQNFFSPEVWTTYCMNPDSPSKETCGWIKEDGMWVLIAFPIGFLFIRAFPGILGRRYN